MNEFLVFQKIGNLHMAGTRYYDAIKVFKGFLDHDPLHPDAPSMALGIIEGYERLKLVDLFRVGFKKFFVPENGLSIIQGSIRFLSLRMIKNCEMMDIQLQEWLNLFPIIDGSLSVPITFFSEILQKPFPGIVGQVDQF